MWKNFTDAFYLNFISDDRWHYIADGLKTTLIITFFACMMGIVLGFIVGMIRSTHDKTGNLKLLNILCKIYLTVIRGTPVVVQLLIIYFVVFGSTRIDKVPVAIMAFGINSGAYVAEIFRSGIMSIDPGQMEAGRSLGFNYAQTMWYVIMPQAFKTVLPTLCNEFISLLKETSVSGRNPGSYQRWRYHPKQNLQCVHAIDRSCTGLSGYCYDLHKTDPDSGKEAASE